MSEQLNIFSVSTKEISNQMKLLFEMVSGVAPVDFVRLVFIDSSAAIYVVKNNEELSLFRFLQQSSLIKEELDAKREEFTKFLAWCNTIDPVITSFSFTWKPAYAESVMYHEMAPIEIVKYKLSIFGTMLVAEAPCNFVPVAITFNGQLAMVDERAKHLSAILYLARICKLESDKFNQLLLQVEATKDRVAGYLPQGIAVTVNI